jgi:hypothetical protein
MAYNHMQAANTLISKEAILMCRGAPLLLGMNLAMELPTACDAESHISMNNEKLIARPVLMSQKAITKSLISLSAGNK